MTTTTTGGAASAAPSRAKRAKTNGQGKSIDFRGLALTLPPDPPGDLAFSIENNEVSAAVHEILGEAQYVLVREKLKDEKLNLRQTFEALRDLLTASFDAWGLDEGEA